MSDNKGIMNPLLSLLGSRAREWANNFEFPFDPPSEWSGELMKRVDQAAHHLNSAGFDPWGLDPGTIKRALVPVVWLYRNYFRVQVSGAENIPSGRGLVIGNHSGQVPIDAMMVTASLLVEPEQPRLARGMVDRWVPSLPFVGTFFSRCGQVIGDPQNCHDLLDNDELVMVFPEGTRGIGKTIFQAYQLQEFGTGFIRLALQTKSPVIPTAVIGCEEIYPAIANIKPLAKLFRAPNFPITPFFPLLGPVGALPLPLPIHIRYGKPIFLDDDPDVAEATVVAYSRRVKEAIRREILQGLAQRRRESKKSDEDSQ